MLVNTWGLVNSWIVSAILNNEIIGDEMGYKKGVAVANFSFGMLDADNQPVTTGTTTGQMTVNGVTSATLANASYTGSNMWNISFTANEMNGDDQVVFTPINASAVVNPRTLKTYTEIDSNLIQMNGATLPVDNLASQYDGTGITGDNFPAQQQQVKNLSSGSGGNKAVAASVVLTSGTSTDPLSNSFYADGLVYEVSPAGGDTDFYFEFDMGVRASGTGVILSLYVQGNNDTCLVQAYNWVGDEWNTIGTVQGTSNQTLQALTPDLVGSQTGTGVNEGLARIRFLSDNANNVGIEQILCEYNVKADTGFTVYEGYAQGGTTQTVIFGADASNIDDFYLHDAVINTEGTGTGEGGIIVGYNGISKTATLKEPVTIAPDSTTKVRVLFAQTHAATTSGGYDSAKVYINGATGEAGTTREVNGIISNPVDNMPDARTIADLVNIKTLSFSGGAALALDQSYIDFKFEFTQGQLFDLNGQDVGGSAFLKSGITGNMIASKRVNFELCGLFDCSIGLSSLLQSGIAGTITLANNDRYQFDQCFANDPAITPTININGNGTIQTLLYLNDYKGAAIISNLTSSDYIEANGNMRLILDSTCSGGTISKNGNVFIEDNSTVSPAFICGLACDTNEAIKLLPTAAQIEARTLPSAEYSQFNSITDSVTINQTSADLVLTSGNVDGYSLEQSQRLILSANAGKLSGVATGDIEIRDASDTKTRISATTDAIGNRITTTLDAD